MREQRAFAAVGPDGKIDVRTVRSTEAVSAAVVVNLPGGWLTRQREGWRIRPVLIRIEDAEEPSHDRR